MISAEALTEKNDRQKQTSKQIATICEEKTLSRMLGIFPCFSFLIKSVYFPLTICFHQLCRGSLTLIAYLLPFRLFPVLVLLLDGLQLNSPNDRMEINKSIRYFFMFLSLLNPLFSPYHLLSSVVSGKLDVDS